MDHAKPAIVAQYRACLAMLRDAIDKCTEDLWVDSRHEPAFWRIAYHTLFFTDLYLCDRAGSFSPWSEHVDGVETLDKPVSTDDLYTKTDLTGYLEELNQQVEERVQGVDLAGPSGMPWLSFSKLELQIYNTRHILHHVGQLTIWLREELGREVDWVGTVK